MREHVTPWIRESGLFNLGSLSYKSDLSKFRLTVDEPEDLELIKKILDLYSIYSYIYIS